MGTRSLGGRSIPVDTPSRDDFIAIAPGAIFMMLFFYKDRYSL